MIPAWAGKWIGLPYADKGRGPAAYDCWGIVRAVLGDVAGVALPDYAGSYTTACDRFSVADAVRAGLAEGWHRVDVPRALDLLILRIAGRPWHCGLIVDHNLFLHAPPPGRDGRELLSCIERMDSPTWARRIEGVYRHG